MEMDGDKYKELRIKKQDGLYLKNKLYTLNSRMKRAQFENNQEVIRKTRHLIMLLKEYTNLYAT
jgi:hypothetical protein